MHYAKVHSSKKSVSKDIQGRLRSWVNAMPKPLFDLMEADARAIAVYEKAQTSLLNDKKHTRWMDDGEQPKTALEASVLRSPFAHQRVRCHCRK